MKHSRKKLSKCSRRCFSWSNLPGEAIFEISKKLETRDDILHFKRVCSEWRRHSVTPPQNLLSFNIPLPNTIKNGRGVLPFHNSKSPLALGLCNIYLIMPNNQSSKPWMIMAEELNPGKIRVRHPLTGKRVINFPPFLDMTQFQALKLAQGYYFKSSNCRHKVLLCSSSASSLEVMVLYDKGVLGKLSLEVDDDKDLSYSWKSFKVPQSTGFRFVYLDDVARFRDMNCGVDRNGRLYMLDMDSMTMSNSSVLVSEPISSGDIPKHRRKRLVVDSASGELHLVVREKVLEAQKVRFKVYKFNEDGKRWDVVENIGHERVLFVGICHSFFAMARHFPGCDGNSIVFAADCFPQYYGFASDKSLFGNEGIEVGMYRLGEGDNFVLLPSAYPTRIMFARIMFAGTIWPPPAWFCTRRECKEEKTEEGVATNQTCDKVEMLLDCSDQNYVDEDGDEEMESDRSCTVGSKANDKREKPHSRTGNIDFDASDANFSDQIGKKHSNAQEQVTEEHFGVAPVNEHFALHLLGFEEETMRHTGRHDQTCEEGPDFTEEKVFDAYRTPVTPSISSAGEKSSTVKFQGVDIRSELLPTLQTIWAKHGNLTGEDTVHSKKMLGCALEELAELIITLQNTTARTLTDSQTNDMRSILSDIQRVGLKVDWLAPVIEKATAVLKSRPLIESIASLEKKKAKIEEEERELFARTSKAKQEIEESIACLSTSIPFPVDQIIDLDDFLGDGL